ncbi:isochorismatase domain-containing protein 2 mitochondrial [Biomphalaria pfeifferi]|uniref:Isochorismatase domain-containing protein 2 mitochondrial n=1 Tax=Biomphalaria pfeifferi TaxID=112525 RepID=A0AAD8BIA0_BIOPF|nr:isochorismatase domain-containing protein 2 mitochondrial [Biomphalaria pfeifferi]
MASRSVGKILYKNAALFVCDMQEKFRPTIQYFPQILNVAGRLLKSAEALGLPVLFTEQYPKGLGHTVSELDVKQHKVFPKTCFSMMVPSVETELKKYSDVKSIVLCGIEAHACVQQTVFDLIEGGYDVHVIVDACSSRSLVDRMFAYQRMKEAGAHLTTCESILLGLLRDASHPKFKEIQKLIMEPSPDSALVPV